MISEIICIGTSYTWGDGIDIKKNKEYVDWYKKNKNLEISRETHSFPSVLEKLSNIKTRNLGKCGSSVEYVCRNVEELLEKEDLSDKLLILEYANYGRSELWSNKYQEYIVANWGKMALWDNKIRKTKYNTFLTIDYGCVYKNSNEVYWDLNEDDDIYNKFCNSFYNESEILIKNDRNFINLLYKLSKKNIKFLVIPLEPFFWNQCNTDDILQNNLYKFEYKSSKKKYGLSEWISFNKLRIQDIILNSTDNHPNVKGYEEIAKKIYNYYFNKII